MAGIIYLIRLTGLSTFVYIYIYMWCVSECTAVLVEIDQRAAVQIPRIMLQMC